MEAQTIREIMTPRVITVAPDLTVRELARLLLRNKVSGVPVVNPQGQPIGIVSKSDILDCTQNDGEAYDVEKLFYRRALGMASSPASPIDREPEILVGEIMTPIVLSLSADTPIPIAARMMVFEGVHRVIVTEDGKMVGILTPMDVVRAVGGLAGDGRATRPLG
jgi:CBS domain-containing protein